MTWWVTSTTVLTRSLEIFGGLFVLFRSFYPTFAVVGFG